MYAKVESGSISTYPYNIGKLRKEHKNTSFPSDSFSREDIKGEYGIVDVSSSAPPSSMGYHVREGTPELVNGVWTQTWTQTLKSPSEVDDGEKVGTVIPTQEGKNTVEILPVHDGSQWNRTYEFQDATWEQARVAEYGPVAKQLEFITENGLDAWQTKVSQIKSKYPKVV